MFKRGDSSSGAVIEALRKMEFPKSPGRPSYRSETSYYREFVLPYCQGNGLDIGYGGDPVKPSAITIDFDPTGALCGDHPCNITGDAKTLPWFADRAFDYVYSSHCLEDFPATGNVVREWLRVIKIGGYLVLLLPDQRKYEQDCRNQGLEPNPAHKIADFGPDYLRDVLQRVKGAEIILIKENLGAYNFLCVVRRIKLEKEIRNRLRTIPALRKLKKALRPGKPPASGPAE